MFKQCKQKLKNPYIMERREYLRITLRRPAAGETARRRRAETKAANLQERRSGNRATMESQRATYTFIHIL